MTPQMSAEQCQAVHQRQEAYRTTVAGSLNSRSEVNPQNLTVEEQWSFLRDSLTTAAEHHLGFVRRSQPDWFVDSRDIIFPLLQARTLWYNKWVSSGSASDHVQFKTAQSKACAEVRSAKDHWLAAVASQAELGRVSCRGLSVWSAIWTIQRSYCGLCRMPSPAIRDEHGELCQSAEAQLQR